MRQRLDSNLGESAISYMSISSFIYSYQANTGIVLNSRPRQLPPISPRFIKQAVVLKLQTRKNRSKYQRGYRLS